MNAACAAPGGARIGIFGGTFNPIHLGHLRSAEEVAEALDLERVLFIPSARPPHKDASEEEKAQFEKDQAAHAKAMANFKKEQDKYRAAAEKLFLKILTLVKVRNETNTRDDMCTKAARILGNLGPFLDAKGNPVGTPQTVRIPGTGDVPSDATDFRLERVDCEEEEEDAGDGILAPGIAPGWVFAGGPIEPGASSSTRAYSMTVAHVDRERAQEIRDEVLAGGLALPIPPNVRIHHHSTSELVGTDLVLTLADDESFESLTLAVNGNPAYATLDDALLFTRRNWSVAVLRVPQDDLDYDPAPGAEWSNDLGLRYEVTEQGLHRARGAFTYTQ